MKASLLLLLLAAVFLMFITDVFAWNLRFQITNRTGEEIVVTSSHTHDSVRISSKMAALVPHGTGDIVIKRPNGTTWRYRDLSPLQFDGTPYMVVREYHIPFGGGSKTVGLFVDKDGRMYVVLPGAKDINLEKLEQPKGFPVKPDDAKGMDKGSERAGGDKKG
jgi:hypothetical protein